MKFEEWPEPVVLYLTALRAQLKAVYWGCGHRNLAKNELSDGKTHCLKVKKFGCRSVLVVSTIKIHFHVHKWEAPTPCVTLLILILMIFILIDTHSDDAQILIVAWAYKHTHAYLWFRSENCGYRPTWPTSSSPLAVLRMMSSDSPPNML